MSEGDTYSILTQMFLAVLYSAGPIMALALGIGLLVAFFQALTQIQEMTLTFVPKIVAIFLGLLFIGVVFLVPNGLLAKLETLTARKAPQTKEART